LEAEVVLQAMGNAAIEKNKGEFSPVSYFLKYCLPFNIWGVFIAIFF
jgi:hypothetical protein